METRASYVLVGSFVLVAAAALVAFLIWVGAAGFDAAVDRYRIEFEGSVNGLQPGSAVRYQGIRVGQVTSLGIDPVNPERVRAVIEVVPGTPVVQGVVASLELQGVTGGVYVQLAGGTAGAPPLVPLPGEELAVIPSRTSGLAAVLQSVPDLIARTTDLIGGASGFFTVENQQAIASILANVDRVTGSLADQTQDLRAATQRLEALMTNVDGLVEETRVDAARLSDGAAGLIATLDTQVRQVSASIQSLSAGFTESGNQLATLLRRTRPALEDFANTGTYEFSLMVAELRELAENLSRVALRLEEGPTQFLLGGTNQGVAPER